ncbi:MAG: molybdopterin-synthase adenylyltransferase MoeB [Endomicrobium sp.]|jgi:adenylyltransferase/sulfurtransferase|nr:molybdopterin-synthase adenylyltransferase MoeB [Endomicrobium sp.]
MQNFYERHKDHILLKEIGVSGQKRIKSSSVLVVGVGGLGSPLALYLAAAGVGTIGIIDFDTVDVSNLQRQILYNDGDVNKSKIEIAKERIKKLNPKIKVNTYNEKLTSVNVLDIFRNYNIVADAADNFQTRYLVNDACALSGISDVWASVYKFEGQVSIFEAKKGACYRCFHPFAPKPGSVPSCGEGGVIGAITGIIGSIQACEVLKIITGAGTPLVGRLLYFDALHMLTKEFKIKKDKNCSLCGTNSSTKELQNYDEFCQINKVAENEITPDKLKIKLKNKKNIKIITICEENEKRDSIFPNSLPVTLNNIVFLKNKLNTNLETIFVCKYGYKSIYAIQLLKESGYKGKMYSLKGGTNKYQFL